MRSGNLRAVAVKAAVVLVVTLTPVSKASAQSAVSDSAGLVEVSTFSLFDKAVEDFEAAAKLDPNNKLIKQNLERAKRREKGL